MLEKKTESQQWHHASRGTDNSANHSIKTEDIEKLWLSPQKFPGAASKKTGFRHPSVTRKER